MVFSAYLIMNPLAVGLSDLMILAKIRNNNDKIYKIDKSI